jgi:hypothetical protein
MTAWHPLSANVGNHFADKRRSLGRYGSLEDSDHGVCWFVLFDNFRNVTYKSGVPISKCRPPLFSNKNLDKKCAVNFEVRLCQERACDETDNFHHPQ